MSCRLWIYFLAEMCPESSHLWTAKLYCSLLIKIDSEHVERILNKKESCLLFVVWWLMRWKQIA